MIGAQSSLHVVPRDPALEKSHILVEIWNTFIWEWHWPQCRHGAQSLSIFLGGRSAGADELIQMTKLVKTNSRAKFVHPPIISELHMIILAEPLFTLIPKDSGSRGYRWVCGCYHASLRRCHNLGGVERKGSRVSESAGVIPPKPAAVRVRGIFE